MSSSAKLEIAALRAELDRAKKGGVASKDLSMSALESYPKYGSKIPRHDFSKPDNYDANVSSVNERSVRERSKAPKTAKVYQGYIPIEYLKEVLAEDSNSDSQAECFSCGHVDDVKEFRGKECPECESDDIHKQESTYDWSEYSTRSVFPPAEVHLKKSGEIELVDGNHRVSYWREIGMTHAPAWIVDSRTKAQRGE